MKPVLARRHAADLDTTGLSRVLPQIQSLIEGSRQHVVSTANLTLVWLYWNVGRIITEDIQKNQKRAEYGEQLLTALADNLTGLYGRGFSRPNLQDMRRFFEAFEIRQPPANKFDFPDICQTPSSKSASPQILQPAPRESSERIQIDFTEHYRIGWSHYRILLSLEAGLKRQFYFDQSAQQRWATRELSRQIDRALFERVALSRDTRALVRFEKQRGPVETVRYEDAFKDPYLLDFLGRSPNTSPNFRLNTSWPTGSKSTAGCWNRRMERKIVDQLGIRSEL